jgi:dimethylpropiothetin dethiomethylase
MTATLGGSADWLYVLREFEYAYRNGSAGGSPRIRSHMKAVRDRLAKAFAANPPIVMAEKAPIPVEAHLERAVDNGLDGMMRSMVKAVENVKGGLAWEYGYERVPRHLTNKYGYATIMGPDGPVVWPDLTLGLVLFGPHTTYPAHSHDGITESYLSLSGFWSENDMGTYAPGSMVMNLPNHTHTITTADREPVLLAYAWVGPPEKLADPVMKFSRKSNRAGKLA